MVKLLGMLFVGTILMVFYGVVGIGRSSINYASDSWQVVSTATEPVHGTIKEKARQINSRGHELADTTKEVWGALLSRDPVIIDAEYTEKVDK